MTNENVNHGEDEFLGRVGGKYDFIMMVGDGTVYGFVGREIIFSPVGNIGKPIGFQWEPVKGKDVDFNWLPLDGEYDEFYDDYVDGKKELAELNSEYSEQIVWNDSDKTE